MTRSGALPIAFLMTSFEPGGTEGQMVELLRRLDPARWEVHLACFHARGLWLHRAVQAAATIAEFPLTGFGRPDAARQAAAFTGWCRTRRIAILHTTDLYANVFGLPLAALARVPVRVANRREVNPDKTTAQILMQRAAYSFAHTVVANSGAAAERLRDERVPARKIVVVANGLDVARFRPGPRRTGRRRVVVVANLRSEKGHDVLLDAAALILRQAPDARFDIVGDGPMMPALRARADALGVAHAVTFFGHCDEVEARLAAADIFALPSRSEALPNALLEAMSAGLPVVASAVGGIVDLVEHNRTGLLVRPGDPRILADQLLRIMASPTLGCRFGEAARAEMVARYSFDRMVAAFEDVYRSALRRRGLTAPALARMAS